MPVEDTLTDFQAFIQSMRDASLERVKEARIKMEEEQAVLKVLNDVEAYLIYLKTEAEQQEKKL